MKRPDLETVVDSVEERRIAVISLASRTIARLTADVERLTARIAALEAAVGHCLLCEAALGGCCIEALTAVATDAQLSALRGEPAQEGRGIFQGCGDCDPCLSGRPDQCAVGAVVLGTAPEGRDD